MRVWDYDMGSFGSDDFLGQVVLPLNMLAPDETCDRWFDLEARPESRGKDQVKGQIRLKILCRFQRKTSRPSTGQVLDSLPRAAAWCLLAWCEQAVFGDRPSLQLDSKLDCTGKNRADLALSW